MHPARIPLRVGQLTDSVHHPFNYLPLKFISRTRLRRGRRIGRRFDPVAAVVGRPHACLRVVHVFTGSVAANYFPVARENPYLFTNNTAVFDRVHLWRCAVAARITAVGRGVGSPILVDSGHARDSGSVIAFNDFPRLLIARHVVFQPRVVSALPIKLINGVGRCPAGNEFARRGRILMINNAPENEGVGVSFRV